ncbi:phage tail protein (plasmid) [Deinococcus geothermalis DSM 11300]|uniref:Phage tail protein n=1 Tax=Deinococcus geothermalis (strain DSM 11300 / CIP 105573 / AG-3a) TaxID=319795 RepID=A8ZRG1_DEIGD|nr:baseplate J/gp47 family protein [Deinococcus geothermalis]ABW35070.1 phage tail protein [Deinococcus geothermalis DSM 11300]
MYYLKTFEMALTEIIRHLSADLGPTVDLVEGSDTLSLAEAVAFQAADLSERQERSILEAIPEAVYLAFGFGRLPAVAAQGTLVFTAPVPARDVIFIPAGAEAISDDEQTFRTTQDAYIAPGQSEVSVPAVAVAGGAAGNVGALSVVRLANGVPGVQGVSNPTPFTGGADEEGTDARAARFTAYIASLDASSKSGLTLATLKASIPDGEAAISADNALVLDRDDDPGIPPAYTHVLAYRRGGLPAALQDAIRAAVEDARAGGTVVLFEWTAGTPVNVSVGVTCPDVTVRLRALEAVRQAVAAYFAGLTYGQKASYENLVTVATKAHPGITEVAVSTPGGGDVSCGPRERLELGTLTVNPVDA